MKIAVSSLLAIVLMSGSASASRLLYRYTSLTEPDARNFTFMIDSQPSVSFFDPNEFYFTVIANDFRINGMTISPFLNFYIKEPGNFGSGGVDIYTGNFATFYGKLFGPQLFAGSVSSPTLLNGNFTISEGQRGAVIGSLLVTEVAVPELGSWAMMILGMGVIGGMMRRRKVTTLVSYAV